MIILTIILIILIILTIQTFWIYLRNMCHDSSSSYDSDDNELFIGHWHPITIRFYVLTIGLANKSFKIIVRNVKIVQDYCFIPTVLLLKITSKPNEIGSPSSTFNKHSLSAFVYIIMNKKVKCWLSTCQLIRYIIWRKQYYSSEKQYSIWYVKHKYINWRKIVKISKIGKFSVFLDQVKCKLCFVLSWSNNNCVYS